jgi:uncharacterized membrane protein YvbJ
MSLWEKWEREKLEKQGIQVERRKDVEIFDMRPKRNIRKQILVVFGVTAVCLVLVYAAMLFEAIYSGRRWSDTYIIRFIAARSAQRENQ